MIIWQLAESMRWHIQDRGIGINAELAPVDL